MFLHKELVDSASSRVRTATRMRTSIGTGVRALILFILSAGLGISAFAQTPTTVPLSTPGSSTWVVPAGVINIKVEVWGGGGGGGGANGGGTDGEGRGGGGGGGGAFRGQTTMTVVPAASLNYTVGAGGAGGIATDAGGQTDGGDGGQSTFNGVTADGGMGGDTGTGAGAGTETGAHGAGGAAGSVVAGQTNFAGGDGDDASPDGSNQDDSDRSGGGGGGAGNNGNGTTSNSATGGAGGNGTGGGGGGAGGNGSNATNHGTAGAVPAAGGGGGFTLDNIDNTDRNGGAGADGLIKIIYTIPAVSTIDLAAASDSNVNTDNITNLTSLTITGTTSNNNTIVVQLYDGVSTIGGTANPNGTTGNWSINLTGVSAGSHSFTARATHTNGNYSTSAAMGVIVDQTAPTSVTIANAGGQANPEFDNTADFTVVFNEAIHPASFVLGDFVKTGTATYNIAAPTTSDNITWNITATASVAGTVIPTLNLNQVIDIAGNTAASTANLGTPSVTIAPFQPTSAGTIATAAVTSSSVNITHAAGDGAQYLIVGRQGAVGVSFSPTDGQTYSVDPNFQTSPADGSGNKILGLTSFGAAFPVTNLQPGIQYQFAAFAVNGSSTLSNYLTTAATTSVTTPAAEVTLTNGAGNETLKYLITTASPGTLVFDFAIVDGADGYPARVSNIIFGEGSGDDFDWTEAILGARLSDGTNALESPSADVVIGASTIAFNNINTANLGLIGTGATKNYTLTLWLDPTLPNTLPQTIDGMTFSFALSTGSFTFLNTGSTMAASQSAASGSGNNEVDVIATTLVFTQEPPATATTTVPLTAANQPSLEARDDNGNLDLDPIAVDVVATDDEELYPTGAPTEFIDGIMDFATAATFRYDGDGGDGSGNSTLTVTTVSPALNVESTQSTNVTGSTAVAVNAAGLYSGLLESSALDKGIFGFTLTTGGSAFDFTFLRLSTNFEPDGKVTNIRLIASPSATFTLTGAIPLATGTTPTSGTIEFTGFSHPVNSSATYYYVVVDVAPLFPDANTLELTLTPSAADVVTKVGGMAGHVEGAITGSAFSSDDFVFADVTPSVVLSVASSTADGYYNVPDVISIQVNFNEAVNVTGTPTLALNSGGTSSYTGGTGTATLTFTYTVAASQNSTDLDYLNTSALAGTIKDLAGNSATLTLATPGALNSISDNQAIVIDTATPTVASVASSTADGYYNVPDVITIQVAFSEIVVVTGTPTLTLNSGGTASYSSGSNSNTLTFLYTVGAGDDSDDLDYVATTSLTGTIADLATNPADLTLATPGALNSISDNKAIDIDTTDPTVVSVSSTTADGYYNVPDVITIEILFDEPVVPTGTPTLALNSGGTASYSSGTGTNTLTFTYTVAASQNSTDLDYSATSSLSGTIADLANNSADLTLATPGAANSISDNQDIIIDTTPATVSSVSSTAADGFYNVPDVILINVVFSEVVTVTGTPTLALNSGGTASYTGGSNSTTLTFSYTVAAGNNSTDLDYAATSSLSGTIVDLASNASTLTLASPGTANSISDNQAIVVDTTPATVSSVSSSTGDGYYNVPDVITINVVFSEIVLVTGTPTLALNSGGSASYLSGSNSNTLTFTYTVAAGHNSTDLDYSATNSLSGTILDRADNASTLTLVAPSAVNSISDNQAIVIDTTTPTVTSVASSTADGYYNVPDVITIQVNFGETVVVTGTPTLALNSGGTASYSSGSNSNILTFLYTVGAGDDSDDLDYVTTSSLTGTIADLATNPADLTLVAPGALNSISDNKAIDIDTTDPNVVSVSSSTADGYYNVPDVITIQILFDEPVATTGTPTLALNSGGTANYSGGTGTNTLTFTYTVAASQNSTDLDYTATNSLAGTIRDLANNNAVLTLVSPGATNSISDDKAIIVDTTPATVSSVSSTATDGFYNVPDVILINVVFSEVVTVTGTPTLALNSGGTASYTGGSNSTTLTFSYTVAAGNNSTDLDYSATNSLSGTIVDLASNASTLTLATPGTANSISDNQAIVVDTTPATVSSVSSSTANGFYNVPDVITINVVFSEIVLVTGTPTLALNSGGTASYASGSNSNTLTFTYTVAAGHNSADLDYTNTTALTGTILDRADNASTLTLFTPGAVNSISDNQAIVIDTTTPLVTSVASSTADGYYNVPDVITIQVNFSETVVVTGTPTLALNSGGTASYSSGSNSSILTFLYTVGAGDDSDDLDYITTTSLTGTIADLATNPADLTLVAPGALNSISDNKAIDIDTTDPNVLSVSSSTADGYYNVPDVITIQILFDEPVATTGTPTLALNSGGTANYSGGTGTNTLTFTYTVAASQNSTDLDYTATNSLAGTIRDLANNNAVLTLVSPGATNSISDNQAIIVDTTPATVSSVSSSTANGFYNVPDVITIQIVFSETVVVTGTPALALNSGGTASYISGSNSNTLTFTYTVAAGNNSADLDYSATNSLSGTIRDLPGNNSTLTLVAPGAVNSISDNQAIVIDTTPATVSSVSSSTANGFYNVPDVITINVVFSEIVLVTGTPTLALNSGGTASYVSGSNSNTLTFTYTVAAGHNSADLDYSATNSLTGTILDRADNASTLTLVAPGAVNSISDNQAIVIDTTTPLVTSVASSTADGYYNVPDVITIQVNFSETVVVTGTPTLALNSGGTANYSSGSNSNILTFLYIVGAGDDSNDLDYVATTSLTGTIADLATNPADLTLVAPGALNSISDNKAIDIDTTDPTVVSVSSSTADGYYNAADIITIQISFDEPVVVTGTPTLALNSGGTASYSSGSNSSTLTFTYTVAPGHNNDDLDYTATNSLAGTIRDLATNLADLTLAAPGALNSISDNKSIDIDTVIPTVLALSSTNTDGYYNAAEVITIQVLFSEPVNVVSGTPTLALNSGGTANYSSGSGTATLTFTYTVAAGHNNDDLDYTATNSLAGNIRDFADNVATLTLVAPNAVNSISDNQTIDIDTVTPTVTSVSSTTPDGYYNAGDVITIQVLFSEPVAVVSGVPTLTLNSGGTASYSSGTGTNTLTFTYTVLATHNTDDLDYSASLSLAGNIRDFADNIATLTLATPGAVNSISDDKVIDIDTVTPTVTSVSSTAADGYYNAAEVITIQVVFSEPVVVASGVPTILLNSGGTASYASGSGTDTFNFTYTVLAGHNSDDLDYVNTNSLTGDIRDLADNSTNSTLPIPGAINSISDNQTIDIDTVTPTVLSVSSSTANGYYNAPDVITIQIAFSEPVNVASGTPTLTLNSGGTASYASGTGTSTLTFTYTVAAGHNNDDLDYVNTSSLSGNIRDFADNVANLTLATPNALNSISDNKSIDIDTVLPVVVSVSSTTPDGYYNAAEVITLQVLFSEPVNVVTGTPTLVLNSGGTANYSSGSGTSTLTFTYTVLAGHNSDDLDYSATNSLAGDIRDFADNNATLTLPTPGALNSISDNQTIDIDTQSETVLFVASTTADGYYNAGDIITIQIKFSEPVVVNSGTPELKLFAGGPPIASAFYLSGSGTDTFTFTYTVLAGENSDDLDYVGTTSLSGDIRDFGDNSATLTLPTPGALNSISDNQAIDIDTVVPEMASNTITGGLLNGIGTSNGATAVPALYTVTYNVDFTEPVTGVDPTDFLLTAFDFAGDPAYPTISSVVPVGGVSPSSGPATSYVVTVNILSGTGRLRLDLNSAGTIEDLALNDNIDDFTSGEIYSIVRPEPTNNPTAPSAIPASPSEVTVSWTNAVGVVKPTHLLITATGPVPITETVPAAFVPVDGFVYPDNEDFTDGQGLLIVDLVANPSQNSITFHQLRSGKLYNFKIYPYSLTPNNSSDNANYKLTGNVSANATTQTSSVGTLTSINAGVPATISSLSTGFGAVNFSFQIKEDGPAITEASDDAKMFISQIVIKANPTANQVTDWSEVIEEAELREITENPSLDILASGVAITANTITFDLSSLTDNDEPGELDDNEMKEYRLRIRLKTNFGGDAPENVDGQRFEFMVVPDGTPANSSFTFLVNSSGIELSQSATSDHFGLDLNNRVNVIATQFDFSTQPPATIMVLKDVISASIHPDNITRPVVRARDTQGNTDKDYSPTVQFTNAAGVHMMPDSVTTMNVPMVQGVAQLPLGFQYADEGDGTLTIHSSLANESSTTIPDKASSDIDVSYSTNTAIGVGDEGEVAILSSVDHAAASAIAFDFSITDINAGPVDDGAPTLISQIKITDNGTVDLNWLEAIETVYLHSDDAGAGADVVGAVTANEIIFSNIAHGVSTDLGYVPSGAPRDYQMFIKLRASLQGTLPDDIDNKHFRFKIDAGDITLDPYSSVLNSLGTTNSDTGGPSGKVEVITTALIFITEPPTPPSDVFVNTNLVTSPKVEAQDANANRDIDYNPSGTNVVVTNGGGLPMTLIPTAFTTGVLSFDPNFQYTHIGNEDGTLTITTDLPAANGNVPAPAVSNPVRVRVAVGTTITLNGTGTPPEISSLVNGPAGATAFKFDITDDSGAENDGSPTQIISVTILAAGDEMAFNANYNWTDAILGATLSDGTKTVPVTSINPTSLFFNLAGSPGSDPVVLGQIANDATETFTLNIWLKNNMPAVLANEIDGLHFEFEVDQLSIVTDPTRSSIIPGEIANSGPGNVVDVDASRLDITTPDVSPTSASLHTPFPSPIVVEARDANRNRDLDFTGVDSEIDSISNESNSIMVSTPPVKGRLFTNGVFTFPADFRFTSGNDQDLVTLFLRAGKNSITPVTPIMTLPSPAPFTPVIKLNASFSSVLDVDSLFVPTLGIRYLDFQDINDPNESVALAQFRLFDGPKSGNGDLDGASTNIDSITFSITNPENISALAIYEGNTLIGVPKNNGDFFTDVVSGLPSVTFKNLSSEIIATDAAPRSTVFTVRASFYSGVDALSNIHDNDSLQLHVTSVGQNGGSRFKNPNDPTSIGGVAPIGPAPGGAISDPNVRIEVMADSLHFATQPEPYSPTDDVVVTPPVVEAVDVNGVVDLDVTGVDGSVTFTCESGPSLAQFTNAPTQFTNGHLTFPSSFQYTAPGNGTLTGRITNGDGNIVTDSSSHVDVLHLMAELTTLGVIGNGAPGFDLRGGDRLQPIFGITFKAPYTSPEQPKLTEFTVDFDTEGSVNGVFGLVEVYRSTDSTFQQGADKNVINPDAGKATVVLENEKLKVTFANPEDISATPLKKVTYFVVADVATTVSASTPTIQPILKDFGHGTPTEGNIKSSQGSQDADLQGTIYSFASVNAPVIVQSFPSVGQLNVSTEQETINIKFSVKVICKDSITLIQKDKPSVRFSLPVLNHDGVTAVDALQFAIPEDSLKANTVYYISVGENVIIDEGKKPLLPITFPDLFYFKTFNPEVPKIVTGGNAPVTEILHRSKTGATVAATFDKKGRSYFLVVEEGDVDPTTDQILGEENYADSVFWGYIDIEQINSISSFGLITAPLDPSKSYDLWMLSAAYEAKSNPVLWFKSDLTLKGNTDPFGAGPIFTVGGAGPTLKIPAMTLPVPTGIQIFAPTIGMCSNSYQPQNLPITIVEGDIDDFDTGGVLKSFNLLLPNGYQFDNSTTDGKVNYGKVILTGEDFDQSSGSLSYLNNSIVTIKYKTKGTSLAPTPPGSLDNISIVGLRFISDSQAEPGDLTRLGGSAFQAHPVELGDGAIFASLTSSDAPIIRFTNSYSRDVFPYDTLPKPPVTIIPNNYGLVELIPLPDITDYGFSTFSGAGVNVNQLNLSAVTTNVPFVVTITHTDNNGCISENGVQYTVYDPTKAIGGLATQYCIECGLDPRAPAPVDEDVFIKQIHAFNNVSQLSYMTSLEVKLPNAGKLMGKNHQEWRDLIEGIEGVDQEYFLVKDSLPGTIPNTTATRQSYAFDFAKLLNVPFVNSYDSLLRESPIQKQKYWVSDTLGVIEFTARYINLSNRQLEFPLRQNVEFWLPAVPLIEVSSTGKRDLINDVTHFCQDNGVITINGFPDATSGPFVGTFVLYDENDVDISTNKAGFIDNGNGSATLDPKDFFNGFGVIRIEYTYHLNGSPCTSKANKLIRITPNPIADFTINAPACDDIPVKFDGSDSDFGSNNHTDFSIAKYEWDFADVNDLAKASGVDTVHTYIENRLYKPTLLVTSNFKCESPKDTLDVKVGAIPVAQFTFEGLSTGSDKIWFTDHTTVLTHPTLPDGRAKLEFTFGEWKGTPKKMGDTTITTNFANAIPHRYDTAGYKTVTLKVTSTVGCTDSTGLRIIVLPKKTITDAGFYEERFETSDGGWQVANYKNIQSIGVSGVQPSWEWGAATKPRTTLLPDDATKYWTNRLAGGYNADEKSAIYSPAFDMSDANLSRPMISFKGFADINPGDGVVLEYSLDNKNVADSTKVWEVLISEYDENESGGENWYNAQGLGSQPGGVQTNGFGWTGLNSGWKDRKHVLDSIAVQPDSLKKHVVFRLALSGGGTVASDLEGFSFDDVRIGNRTRTVLVETFTNLGGNIADEESQADFLKKFNPSGAGTRLVRINYHVGFPWKDPFNIDNPQDPGARALYYGIKTTPRTRLDGWTKDDTKLFELWGPRAYNVNTLKLAEASLTPVVTPTPGGYSVRVDIKSIIKGTTIPEDAILHIAIVERNVLFSDLKQSMRDLIKTSALPEFQYVLKKMLPSAVGTRIGKTIAYDPNPNAPAVSIGPFLWEADRSRLYKTDNDLTVVVFLQDELTGHVYQAESADMQDPGVVTGLEDGLRIEDVEVYPNPANQEVNILLPRRAIGDVNVVLIDQLGKPVIGDRIADGERSKALDVQDLSSGMYILQLQENGKTTFKKIMVVH